VRAAKSILVLLVPFVSLLSSCGFHLRGIADMPRWLTHIAIIEEHTQRELGPYLTSDFQSYQLIVDTDPALARYWLVIEQDNYQEHVTSISSSTTPRQYEFIYTLRFKLLYAKGKEIIPSTNITVTRQATINSDRILGSSQEAELLKNEMRRDAAIQIINRISRESARLNPQP
jgi:LPS-assembly lipoprotein